MIKKIRSFFLSLCLSVTALGLATSLRAAPEYANGQAFKKQLTSDVEAAATRLNADTERNQKAGKKVGRAMVWHMAAMSLLWENTGKKEWLDKSHSALLALIAETKTAQKGAKPVFQDGFRSVLPFCETVESLRKAKRLSKSDEQEIEALLVTSMHSHYENTDYGPQNRALIDGTGFLCAHDLYPKNQEAARWQAYGEAMVKDSWKQWSIEDSSIYAPFWLFYTLRLGEERGRDAELSDALPTRFYCRQFAELQMPNGMMPDWGDGDWTHSWAWFASVASKCASAHKDASAQAHSLSLYHYFRERAAKEKLPFLTGDEIYAAATMLRWYDQGLKPKPLELSASHEVVDDLISKKWVFRDNRGKDSAWMMVNWRDELPVSRQGRDYLVQTLAAQEEKPHHGHADETTVALLMDEGTVLLADGGYRRSFHEGWRADYFHNRVVVRNAMPYNEEDPFSLMSTDRAWHKVTTEKIHFEVFDPLHYGRVRLYDDWRGYEGDRIFLFVPATRTWIIIDSITLKRTGPYALSNVWHPDKIIDKGERWVRAHTPIIPIRKDSWQNPHTRELLVEFLTKGQPLHTTRRIDRRFHESDMSYESFSNQFEAGQRVNFVTVLRSLSPETATQSALGTVELLSASPTDETLGLKIRLPEGIMWVGLKLDLTKGLSQLRGRPMFNKDAASHSFGPADTDGAMAFVIERVPENVTHFMDKNERKNNNNYQKDKTVYGMVDASRVRFGGKSLFDMPAHERLYQGPTPFKVTAPTDRMPRYSGTVDKQ